MSELYLLRCRRCGSAWFPARLRCPTCGGRGFRRESAGGGVIEEETALARILDPHGGAIRLGSVRLDAGPVVIARLKCGIEAGARVRLEAAPDGIVWALPPPPGGPLPP